MFKRFRNIRPGTLIANLAVTLAYPVYKAVSAEGDRLLVFTDTMTIIALVLLLCGVVYSLILHGDLDTAGFVFGRGLGPGLRKDYGAYKADRKEEREAAFNYPLFLGLVYLAAAGVITWAFY